VLGEVAVRAQFFYVLIFVVAAISILVVVMQNTRFFAPSAAHTVLNCRKPLFHPFHALASSQRALRENAKRKLVISLAKTGVGACFRAEPALYLTCLSMKLRSAAFARLHHGCLGWASLIRACAVKTGQRAVTNRRSSLLLMMGATPRAHSGFSAALPPHGVTAGARARLAADRAVSCERLMAYNANCGVNGHATYT
jgi:hypothetical protein